MNAPPPSSSTAIPTTTEVTGVLPELSVSDLCDWKTVSLTFEVEGHEAQRERSFKLSFRRSGEEDPTFVDVNSPNSPIWYREPHRHTQYSVRLLLSLPVLQAANLTIGVSHTDSTPGGRFHHKFTVYRLESLIGQLAGGEVITKLSDEVTGVFLWKRRPNTNGWRRAWDKASSTERQQLLDPLREALRSQCDDEMARQVMVVE